MMRGSRARYQVDANQELFALGAANTISAFFRAYPITGSFSRSSVNASSGVRTPLAGVATGLIVMLALMWLTPVFYYVPKASLAAVIIMSVVRLVEWHEVPHLWARDREDLLVAGVSFALCLLINTEYGIIAGSTVAVGFLLYHTARPKYAVVRGGGFSRFTSAATAPTTTTATPTEAVAGSGASDAADGVESLDAGASSPSVGVGAAVTASRAAAAGTHTAAPAHMVPSAPATHIGHAHTEDVLVTTPFQFQPGVVHTKAVRVPGGWDNQRRVLIPLGTMVFSLRGPLVAACSTHFTQSLQFELNIVRGHFRPHFLLNGPHIGTSTTPTTIPGATLQSQSHPVHTGAVPEVSRDGGGGVASSDASAGGASDVSGGGSVHAPRPRAPSRLEERLVDVHLDTLGPGAPGYAHLILDMAGVPWIDSAGLTALETVIKAARDGVYSSSRGVQRGQSEAEGGSSNGAEGDGDDVEAGAVGANTANTAVVPVMDIYLCGLCNPVWRQLRRTRVLHELIPQSHCCPTVRAAVQHIRGLHTPAY